MPLEGLAGLLVPGSVEDFFAGPWQRSPLYRRRDDPHASDPLFTEAQLEGLLNAGDLRHPVLALEEAPRRKVVRVLSAAVAVVAAAVFFFRVLSA